MIKPDFERNVLRVLNRQKPDRATLFELFFSNDLIYRVTGTRPENDTPLAQLKHLIQAVMPLGYDYATCRATDRFFPTAPHARPAGSSTRSINDGGLISDEETFEKYPWPNFESNDYSILEKIEPYLPEGMKLMGMGPGGIMENVIEIVGYENMCVMLYDDPELIQAVFDNVGSRMLTYYENVLQYASVGFICCNDDWGFNTQTFISPNDMRKYLFPWHKKIVQAAHRHNKPCILHSCGYFNDIIDDLIDDIGFDGRHSYEDNIVPVEEAYDKYSSRIAILGGMDMHFLTRSTPEQIYARSRAMLERSAQRGSYMLGSGNSMADYIPIENYLAMVRAARDTDA